MRRNKYIPIILFLFCIVKAFTQETSLNFFVLNRQDGLSDNTVLSITKDAKGYMWFGTRMGLNRYDGYTFKKYYATDDSLSLPGNIINHLLISKSGELWIGTERNGFCRFDYLTESFVKYPFPEGESDIGSNVIKGIAEASDSTIYVATDKGVFYKDPTANDFSAIPVITDATKNRNLLGDGLLHPTIATIVPDEEEGVWLFYGDWRLTYFNKRLETYNHYSLEKHKEDDNPTLVTAALHINNKLYVSGIGLGLITFSPEDNSTETLLTNSEVVTATQMSRSSDSLIWLASSTGLLHYNIVTNQYHRFANVREDDLSMTTTSVYSHYEDDNNILWVGTMNAGLNFAFKNKPFKHFITGSDAYHALRSDNITEIMYDQNGNLWICNSNGAIEFHNKQTETKTQFWLQSLISDTHSGVVFKTLQTREGVIYAASWRGGVQKYIPEKKTFQPLFGSKKAYLDAIDAIDIRDIEEDKDGDLWLSAHAKGVYKVNPENKSVKKYQFSETEQNTITNNWTYDITIDKEGNIWVGSAWGLSRINPETDEIRKFYSNDTDFNVSINPIEMVEYDSSGDLWISTHLGLGYYYAEEDTFYILNKKNGSPLSQIQSILRDSKGNVWAGTSSGLVKFNLHRTTGGSPEIANTLHFDYDDGLQSNFFNRGAAAINSEGTMYFGGRWGIDYFDPDEITSNTAKPVLRINAIKLFGERINPGAKDGPPINKDGEIVLDYNQNMLGLEYVALTFVNVEGNRYSYKMEPLNTEWVNMEHTRDLVFSDMRPGHYSLSLRVVTDKGQVSEQPDILKFYIKPPFWQKTWFLVCIIIAFMLILIVGMRWYTANLRKKKIQLEKIVHMRTAELQDKNHMLEVQGENLNEVNTLLEERQQHIEEQAEELRVQSENLFQINAELNELNSMKDKFFSIIAHDLKNPFNTIIGFVNLLKSNYTKYTDEKRIQMIEYISNSASGAYTLLENLLHWSRSQTNRLKIEPRQLQLNNVINTNHSILAGMLMSKNLKFSVDMLPDINVYADEALLNTVLRNLLSNAAKFTPTGGEISVIATQKGKEVIIEIKDTGVGMEDKEQKNLFRIDSSTSKKGTSGEEGTGLGLILCKEFVEKMNGRIWVESTKDIGTSFFFSLPVKS